jgi:hypothetical protein
MRVCDYIPLMSPVSWVKKWISNARFAGKRHFFDKQRLPAFLLGIQKLV